jgi:uncharacterized protein YndB with AHSA1/START domain
MGSRHVWGHSASGDKPDHCIGSQRSAAMYPSTSLDDEVEVPMAMEKVKRSIFINAPPAKVFGYLSDPAHLPEVWPSMIEVSNVQAKPDGANSWDWVYKMAGMKFQGRAETVEVQRDRLRVFRNEKGIVSTFRWTFEPRDNGTDFTAEVEYEIPGALLGRLAAPFLRRLNEREADTMMQNTKERMEVG